MKKLKQKIIKPLSLITAIILAVISLSMTQGVEANAAVATGYHEVWHNNGYWTSWGGSLPGCDNYESDSKTCFHYRNWYIIGVDGVHQFSASEMEDGQPMTIVRGRHPDNSNYWADIRVYQWAVTEPECPNFSLNGKMCRFYWIAWRHVNDVNNVWFKEKITGTYGLYNWSMSTWNSNKVNGVYGQHYLEDRLFRDEVPSHGLRSNDGCDYGHDDDWHECDWGIFYLDGSHTLNKYKCNGHVVPNTYTVVYNGNGATGGSTANSSHTYNVAKNLTGNGFTKTNYRFKGWSTDPHATTPQYSNSQSVINLTSTNGGVINLYAIWELDTGTVTYKDCVDSTGGAVLGTNTAVKYCGTTVRGQDRGASTADNAYYNGYYYTGSDTSAVLTASGVTVYRIFKLRTVNISGVVAWDDNSNKHATRPSNVVITLYQDGVPIKTTTGLTGNNQNTFSFENMPKYSTTDGHEYVYSVGQSDFTSSVSPTDKYKTSASNAHNGNNYTFDFLNSIRNTAIDGPDGTTPDPDPGHPVPGNEGLVLKGKVNWEDESDKLGFRPSHAEIILYKGKTADTLTEYRRFPIDDPNDTDEYKFTWLEKYWYDESGNPEKYIYKVAEEFTAQYGQDGNLHNLYRIDVDTPNPFDFTNVLVPPMGPFNPIDENENTVTIRTNTEEKVPVILKKLEEEMTGDLEIIYGGLSGEEIKTSPDKIGEVIRDIPSGKYEIEVDDEYSLDDVKISGNKHVEIIKEGDKWYLVVEQTPENASAIVDIILSKIDDEGYKTKQRISNLFDTPVADNAIAVGIALYSISNEEFVAGDTCKIAYYDGAEDTNEYLKNDTAIILDYNGENSEAFIGWSTEEYSETADYLPGEEITLSGDIQLYPVFDFAEIQNTVSENDIMTESGSY